MKISIIDIVLLLLIRILFAHVYSFPNVNLNWVRRLINILPVNYYQTQLNKIQLGLCLDGSQFGCYTSADVVGRTSNVFPRLLRTIDQLLDKKSASNTETTENKHQPPIFRRFDLGLANYPVSEVPYDYEHITHLSKAAQGDPFSTTNVRSISKTTRFPEYQTQRNKSLLKQFTDTLNRFERNFYMATFIKLSSICPADRRENGISFVQSGIILLITLMALSEEVDPQTKAEIENVIQLFISDKTRTQMIHEVVSMLPQADRDLKLQWASRVAVKGNWQLRGHTATAMGLKFDELNTTEPKELTGILNHLIEADSGGAMRDTFTEDEVSDGVSAVLLNTLNVRARWRSAPTLLNGSYVFHDIQNATVHPRYTRMIRINDIMNYADLKDWDAQALEIFYSTPGLSALLLIPRGQSLRSLAHRVAATDLRTVTRQMVPMRIAAKMPIYTLRMTLLLPNKLQALGMTRLTDWHNATQGSLRFSHAVQRLMFWAEAGRNAYKDDGIEWDDAPELELLVDRPYVFFIRWQNVTIVNGNFVL